MTLCARRPARYRALRPVAVPARRQPPASTTRLEYDCPHDAIAPLIRAARKRNTDTTELAGRIIGVLARDGLIEAVLDDGGGE